LNFAPTPANEVILHGTPYKYHSRILAFSPREQALLDGADLACVLALGRVADPWRNELSAIYLHAVLSPALAAKFKQPAACRAV
jgi:hypothetical protein